MAAVSITLTKISQSGGKIYLTFGKRTREFNNLAHLKAFVADTLSVDALEAMFIRIAIDRQPDLSNPAAFEGHTLTVDTSLANWGKVN